ncbi:MAG: hypothetical protein ACF8MJ_06620 [Phycisphaerales bacterium JB050]
MALVLVGLSPFVAARFDSQVIFNQHLIEYAWAAHDMEKLPVPEERIQSKYVAGLRAMINGFRSDVPDLEDHGAVLSFLLSHMPSRAIVYPTENFYYYRFQDRDGQWVWGNLRLADANAGYLGLTYFHPGSSEYQHKIFVDGQDIEIKQAGGGREYEVTFRGKSRVFFLPEVVTQCPEGLRLLDEERYVGRVIDESAIRFHLIFNTSTRSFYYLLDESAGVPDRFMSASDDILVLERSGFSFYDDSEADRRVLVGVPLKDIMENNYFDGPGDQVPFELNVRDMIYQAYPHTMLHEGIDEHGVVMGTREWQRVAITPYVRYAHLDEVYAAVQRGLEYEDKGQRWTAMTVEWWNTPFWIATQIRRLHEEGKSLLGEPPGLLTIDELTELYPEELSF